MSVLGRTGVGFDVEGGGGVGFEVGGGGGVGFDDGGEGGVGLEDEGGGGGNLVELRAGGVGLRVGSEKDGSGPPVGRQVGIGAERLGNFVEFESGNDGLPDGSENVGLGKPVGTNVGLVTLTVGSTGKDGRIESEGGIGMIGLDRFKDGNGRPLGSVGFGIGVTGDFGGRGIEIVPVGSGTPGGREGLTERPIDAGGGGSEGRGIPEGSDQVVFAALVMPAMPSTRREASRGVIV